MGMVDRSGRDYLGLATSSAMAVLLFPWTVAGSEPDTRVSLILYHVPTPYMGTV